MRSRTKNIKGDFTAEALIERIPKKHLEHMGLVEMVHVADEVFQVYTFAMLATNIPTTIFTLMAFLQRLSVSWADALFTLPEVGLCLFQLTALALTPDQIHREVSAPVRIMHKNTHLWRPYNEHVYHMASVFLHHCSAGDVGISIWGFALMTKSVILTIISLTATYLTVLLQFRTGGECVNVDPFGTNDTTHVA
ncbi:GUR-5 protein [Aphelenchoides avenae]|nr:GUR-5 protein [Aphelenchus avenae]